MTVNYTSEESMLLSTYFTTAFLAELHNNNFLESDYYKNMKFQDQFIKKTFPSIGIGNQGTALMTLYAMLILPKEALLNKYPSEFNNLNQTIDKIKTHSFSTYELDETSINYHRHIRNSLAHFNVDFDNMSKSFIFVDKNTKNKGKPNEIIETFSVTIPVMNIGLMLTELQRIFFVYVESVKEKYK